ncbi:aminotransferase class I/II-fold pyridoxal phosphate-dependent enzyme [Desulfobotulus sp. H1]|uniref:Aminotransferase class I/II-fold pyridoxal phosphate-dependent enzyme n=1 Tax=Desulfobotulus pelophilus TaxID=2823377 RepID=A0ABT3N5Y4_9BACT|nr:aminotransferase class I/II-fold pyridoxal phosphate-dependent enzyme [Desulfobotulus pelophilus]MCW7752868.1 aminotransferase class I/II-fold pyridoxal phosphate-dependent enzyme [Desulfobotulus pelophilus]
MAQQCFSKSFTRQEPIPEHAIERAISVLRSGKLHRYNVEVGEAGEVSELETEFASYIGKRYCLACASCGSAMYLALKSAGVQRGDKVLCNAYTLAPVPGAIENAGADIELVEICEDYTIDIRDLDRKAAAGNAKWLLLSHMRGHMADMDKIQRVCERHGLFLIEDCAHTMGAEWDGRKSGSFGQVSCFSTQTYKHMNSGEGGFLVTDDEELMARAILHSGSYMLYDRHVARPDLEVFDPIKKRIPNYSCRMDNLRAAILRPQLQMLTRQCQRWNERYRLLEAAIHSIEGLWCPPRDPRENYVGSSIQFSVCHGDSESIRLFLEKCRERGVELKWFGSPEPAGFTSAYQSWEYFGNLPDLPNTNRILKRMCDMRIPLTFTLDDCRVIAEILRDVATDILQSD